MTNYILAIDQGTTSSRAILFSKQAEVVGLAQEEFAQHFPQNGWVEHEPEEIWQSTLGVVRQVIDRYTTGAEEIAAIGITNQRETTIVWDRRTGEPVCRAIVWQDRRTAGFCEELQQRGLEATFTDKTGLVIDPYFSATKIHWILENTPGVRARAEAGELAFGTVDCFLLWRLTGGKVHKTDATNASRTMLFNIHDQRWDEDLCSLLRIPSSLLPEVEDCSADFGHTTPDLFGAEIPIAGMAGDQQAALVGQCCFEEGMAKSTYGTGCFVILNTGSKALQSNNRLLTTVAYRLKNKVTYGLEGSIFVAGAAIQWLRDGLGIINSAADSEGLAEACGDPNGVYVVPAFTGLGAPYWDPDARGAILGLTRDTGPGEIVTATLQSVCYQTKDLLMAMERDGSVLTQLRVDGGMVANNWMSEFLADILNIPVDRPVITETTALGVCFLAGLQVGIFESIESLQSLWLRDRTFLPQLDAERRARMYRGWQDAVRRVRVKPDMV